VTARECLASDDPKAVGKFYEELQARGRLGERAFLLLRAHRNISRVRHYDDEKYMKFLRGRAVYAIQQLMEFINENKDESAVDRVVVLVPGAKEVCVRFKRGYLGDWRSTKANEKIILRYCDQVMKEEKPNA
jgi:hypothetical protein